jgi:2'-hydroxyisoflavone reductase
MIVDRRQFIFGSLAAATAAACNGSAGGSGGGPSRSTTAPIATPEPKRSPPPHRTILVLGGTGFLGPHVITSALARGHTVTMFNRGKTHPALFPDVEKLRGDRNGELAALEHRKWDAVVDTSGYVPRLVKLSAELLAPNVGHYVFVSTISVYKDEPKPDYDETAPLMTVSDPTNEDVRTNYGALKALCEHAAEAALPGRVANLRPGLIVGPGDPTGRFTHWPTRMADGGEVLAPGDGTTPTQWIDGRDLGAWIVRVIEQRTVGVYNALGPAQRTTMKQALDGCNAAAGGKATLTWVPADFLAAHNVDGWSDLPMWLDNHQADQLGFGTTSNARAVAAGLTFRPVTETAKDTLAWLATLPDDERAKVRSSGIKPQREAEVLAAWHRR